MLKKPKNVITFFVHKAYVYLALMLPSLHQVNNKESGL